MPLKRPACLYAQPQTHSVCVCVCMWEQLLQPVGPKISAKVNHCLVSLHKTLSSARTTALIICADKRQQFLLEVTHPFSSCRLKWMRKMLQFIFFSSFFFRGRMVRVALPDELCETQRDHLGSEHKAFLRHLDWFFFIYIKGEKLICYFYMFSIVIVIYSYIYYASNPKKMF